MTDQPPIGARHETHGDYADTARYAQHLKTTMHNARNWVRLSPDKREALDLIATKLARILSGEPNEPDHWLDLEGYARLARERLTETMAAREARLNMQRIPQEETDKRLRAQREAFADRVIGGKPLPDPTSCPTVRKHFKAHLYEAIDTAISGVEQKA